MPLEQAEELQREYQFSLKQLRVGGDIPLADLAIHIDKQAALEASTGIFAETARYSLEVEKQEFEMWEAKALQKCRTELLDFNPKYTETYIKGYFKSNSSKLLKKKQKQLLDLEHQYKLLKVMLDAIRRKGDLLPSLRNIVQGKNEGLGPVAKQANKNNNKKRRIKT